MFEALAADLQTQMTAYLLASLRVAGLVLLAPPLSSLAIPASVRMACVLGLAAAVWPVALPAAATIPQDHLLVASAVEFTNGALMATAANIGFAAYAVGARLIDVQIGFGIGQVLDPATRMQMPIITAAFVLLAPVLFVLTDGHHTMLRALALGLERHPIGSALPFESAAGPLLAMAQGAFALGVAMVAPVVLCLLLIELVLGVAARSLPQMNVFLLALPTKLIVGLAALAAWSLASTAPMRRVFEAVFRSWESLQR